MYIKLSSIGDILVFEFHETLINNQGKQLQISTAYAFCVSYQYLVRMNRYFIASYIFVSSIKGEMFYTIINELGFFSLKPSKLMISDNRWSCFNLTKLSDYELYRLRQVVAARWFMDVVDIASPTPLLIARMSQKKHCSVIV